MTWDQKKSRTYILSLTLNGMLGPLMDEISIIQGSLGNETVNGFSQGIIDKANNQEKK